MTFDKIIDVIDASVNDLALKVKSHEGRLMNNIIAGLAGHQTFAQIQKETKATQAELTKLFGTWTQQEIPTLYGVGLKRASDLMGLGSVVPAFGVMHKEALQLVMDNAYSHMMDATDLIGRKVNDTFRQVALQNVGAQIAGGASINTTKDLIIKDLQDHGLTSFVDSAGRQWDLSRYAEMVARTTSMEAYTTGSVNKYKEEGVDLVTVGGREPEEGVSSDAAFQYWQQIISLTGQTAGFPTLEEAEANGLMHPNNWRDLIPLSPREAEDAVEQLTEKEAEEEKPTEEAVAQAQTQVDKWNATTIDGMQVYTDAEGKVWKTQLWVEQAEYNDLIKGYRGLKSNEMKDVVATKLANRMAPTLSEAQASSVLKQLSGASGDVSWNMYPTDSTKSLASGLVQTWARSSDGENRVSCALQELADQIFGGSTFKKWEGKAVQQEANALLANSDTKAVLTNFLQSMYAQTQAELSEKGIKSMTLFRGFTIRDQALEQVLGGVATPAVGEAATGSFILSPMSSFSTSADVAKNFALMNASSGGVNIVIMTKVPRERILGSFASGYGCLYEKEVVVLAGNTAQADMMLAVNVGRGSSTLFSDEFEEVVANIFAGTGD